MGVVSRRWLWVEYMGVATGCGCKEVYRFSHTTYPYSSCICSFLQQHPYFLFIFNHPSRMCAARVTVVVPCVCVQGFSQREFKGGGIYHKFTLHV